jgi:hypothetical protein
MLKFVLKTAVSLTILTGLAHAETVTKSFDSTPIKKLIVSNGSGKVSISTSGSAKASASANKIKVDENCVIVMEQNDTTLKVATEAKGVMSNDCEVDFDIQVPQLVDLEIKTGSGKATVKDTKGKLSYRTGSGGLDFVGEATEVDGAAGSADVSIKGLLGNGELKSGSGDINIVYAQVPTGAKLDIRSGSGDATVSLPEASKPKVNRKSGSGKLTNAFTTVADAGISINSKSGSGDLKIIKN